MTDIPVVCMNQDCGAVFLTASLMNIATGATVTIKDCRAGPCPKCGGEGLIPTGKYSPFGTATLYSPQTNADRMMLQTALRLMRDAVRQNMAPKDVEREARKQIPRLSALWDLIPESKEQAYAFWACVIAAIAIYQGGDQPPQVLLPPDIVRAFQSSQRDSHDGNHIQPTQPSSPPPEPPTK